MDASKPLSSYLASSTYIDWQSSNIRGLAAELAQTGCSPVCVAKSCFEFVRDEIKHSADFKLNPVTCVASDVLMYGTGYCYAKSHLLAALLRANSIPAALCYQRLTIVPGEPSFCLHGLNAVYLKAYGWFRVDARGNKQSVDAQFVPPREQLAFPIEWEGEADFPGLYDEPLSEVVTVLEAHNTYLEVLESLPDMDLVGSGNTI